MSEHHMSATEVSVAQRAGLLYEILVRFGITVDKNPDGGITVRKKPNGTRCFWCGEMIIQPGDEPNRDAITQHTNNCDKNPLVQEVQALRAAVLKVLRWRQHCFEPPPRGLSDVLNDLNDAYYHIYDGSETDE